jgi:hypothetical protein
MKKLIIPLWQRPVAAVALKRRKKSWTNRNQAAAFFPILL